MVPKYNTVDAYSQGGHNVVLAYSMEGTGHTNVPKGKEIAKVKAIIEGLVLAHKAAAAGAPTTGA